MLLPAGSKAEKNTARLFVFGIPGQRLALVQQSGPCPARGLHRLQRIARSFGNHPGHAQAQRINTLVNLFNALRAGHGLQDFLRLAVIPDRCGPADLVQDIPQPTQHTCPVMRRPGRLFIQPQAYIRQYLQRVDFPVWMKFGCQCLCLDLFRSIKRILCAAAVHVLYVTNRILQDGIFQA